MWRNISATERTSRLEIPYEDFRYIRSLQSFLCWIVIQIKYTPLVLAARGGKADLVELLLSKGANIEAVDLVCYKFWLHLLVSSVMPSSLYQRFLSGEIRPCCWLFQWTMLRQLACSSGGRPMCLRKIRLVNWIHAHRIFTMMCVTSDTFYEFNIFICVHRRAKMATNWPRALQLRLSSRCESLSFSDVDLSVTKNICHVAGIRAAAAAEGCWFLYSHQGGENPYRPLETCQVEVPSNGEFESGLSNWEYFWSWVSCAL